MVEKCFLKENVKKCKNIFNINLIFLAVIFAVGGKILLTLPLTLLSLALVKLKGLINFSIIFTI